MNCLRCSSVRHTLTEMPPGDHVQSATGMQDPEAGLTTEGDPVKVSSLKRGSVVNRSAPARLQGSTLNAPGGRCGALLRISAMISAPIGVLEAGFSTNGHLQSGAVTG